MQGNAPTPEQLKALGIHLLSGVPTNPNELAGGAWKRHLDKVRKSHKALVALLGLDPEEALLRLNSGSIFRPFKTIEIGGFSEVEVLCQAIKDSGGYVSESAEDLMRQPAFTFSAAGFLDLCVATNAELGEAIGHDYSGGCTVKRSFAALRRIGAKKLPPEAGPQCRLQHKEQPFERRLMYMDPITDSGGDPRVFCVGHSGDGLGLYGNYAAPRHLCCGDEVWVFTRGSAPVAAQR